MSAHLGYIEAKSCKCGQDIPLHSRNCPYCQADVGFPNVRIAESQDEVSALEKRYNAAKTNAKNSGYLEKYEAFELAVAENSCAVISKPISDVYAMLNSGSLITSFHNQVSMGSRIPQNNIYDRGRQSVDALLFPGYSEQINFAALSLDGLGIPHYGELCISIKDDAISDRATVFHENSFIFVTGRKVVAGDRIPAGFRCVWKKRGKLAAAKLYKKIGKCVGKDEFASILLESSTSDNDNSDFIEVHIYSGLHSVSFKKIRVNTRLQKHDRHIWKQIDRMAKQKGIDTQER